MKSENVIVLGAITLVLMLTVTVALGSATTFFKLVGVVILLATAAVLVTLWEQK